MIDALSSKITSEWSRRRTGQWLYSILHGCPIGLATGSFGPEPKSPEDGCDPPETATDVHLTDTMPTLPNLRQLGPGSKGGEEALLSA